VPRSRLVWLEIADRQYRELPDMTRALIDRRLAQLVENPTVDPAADYNERSDQWSVPIGDDALLFYAVVRELPTVIVLRLVSFA
jgi:mRNA-degrading endonuclease RelE of RelBE toxin-antitoxin system